MKTKLFIFLIFSFSIITVRSQSIDLQNERAVITGLNLPIAELTLQIETSKIKYLGLTNIDSLNLLGASKTNVSNIISNARGQKHSYLYEDFIIQTNTKADLSKPLLHDSSDTELYYTIRALQIFKNRYSMLYKKLVEGLIHPDLYDKDFNNTYFNRYPKIVISFNDVTDDIAISGTWLNSNPMSFTVGNRTVQLYENIPFISIHSELIKGTNRTKGSYPIYKKEKSEDNYLLYLKEGLLHSICHELIHRYFDINNNRWNTVSNYFSFGSGRLDRTNSAYNKHLYNLEEIVLNKTMDTYFRAKGGLSNTLLDYYRVTEESLLQTIPAESLSKYRAEMETKLDYKKGYLVELE